MTYALYLKSELTGVLSPKIQEAANKIRHHVGKVLSIKEAEDPSRASLLIAVGGDGTMVQAIKKSHRQADVMGFNLGNLGYLNEFNIEDLGSIKGFRKVDGMKTEKRFMVQEVQSGTHAVNEFVVSAHHSRDYITYEFFINGISSGVHRANGLIIGTPTGSTAYTLSCGGSILDPGAEVFQITPIAPMSPTSKSVIVPSNSKVRVRAKASSKEGVVELIGDGQLASMSWPGREFFCDFAEGRGYSLMHRDSWNYYTNLMNKLNWNKEF